VTDPEKLLADYEKKAVEAQQRAERVRDGLAAVRVTERSSDGRVAVTVNSTGNLVDLRLAPHDKAGPELAQDILRTLRRAQSRLADAVQDGLGEAAGPETLAELTRQYRAAYPAVDPAEPRRRTVLRLGAQAEEEQPRPGRRERATPDDAEPGYGDRNLLR
jgi:DNA-binding protein YbaB